MQASGLILAGGSSRRMGRDKAALCLGGETLLARAVRTMAQVADEILVVGGPPREMPADSRQVPDAALDAGPMGGILGGLRRARHSLAVVIACDVPLVRPALLQLLIDLAPGYEAVVPCFGGRPQPTVAVYTKDAVALMERQIELRQLRMQTLLEQLPVRWVGSKELRLVDAEGISFRNVNTPREWEEVQRLVLSR